MFLDRFRNLAVLLVLRTPLFALLLVLEDEQMPLVGLPMPLRELVVVLLEQFGGCPHELGPCRLHASLGVRDGMVVRVVVVGAPPRVAPQIDAETSLEDGAFALEARGPLDDEDAS